MPLGVDDVDYRRAERPAELYGLGVLPADVEDYALAVGIARGHCLVERGEAAALRAPSCAALPAQVGHHDGRQRRVRHVGAEVEARAGHLVVAARGAVEAVVRVFLQGVEAVIGRYGGGVADDAGAGLLALLHEYQLLAPVAGHVAHEGRAHGVACVDGPVALAGELHEARPVVLRHYHVSVAAAASGRGYQFALQVAIPPHCLHGIGGLAFGYDVALAVIEVAHGREHLVAPVLRVYVDAAAAAHVADDGQEPLLDVFARRGVVYELAEQVGLLYGVDLEAGAVGGDVAHVEAVAVAYAGRHDHALYRVVGIAALHQLVDAVAVNVGHAALVELGCLGRRVGHGPRVGVMPVCRAASSPVKLPLAYVVVVHLVRAAVVALHGERRVYAVEVADGELAAQEGVLLTIIVVVIVGAVVPAILVVAVGYGIIVKLGVGYLLARKRIYDGYVIRRVALLLRGVVGYPVAVGVGRGAAAHVFSPSACGLVPEACAVGALDDHLAAAVAIDVVGHHHVVLARVDVNVWPHVDGPEALPVERVCLQLVARGSAAGVG